MESSASRGNDATRLAAAVADRYSITRELGRGGMATVYLADDVKHDRDVAIKVLHEDLGATLGPERFLAEIKTTAKLQHPHILPLLDSGAANGLLYYVMPFVDGETLRARLTRETQLPIEDAVRIAREVADALGHAHAHGIVHRDIKPENILLQGGHAVVADFGIALAVQHAGGARLTQTGLSLGTPQYMAPEQAMGEKTIDHHADIYALGAVTYEMLTGEPPFTGATVQAIVARVMSERPTPITMLRDTVPEHVNAAVLKALAKLPADRWGTATGFAEATTSESTPSSRATNAKALKEVLRNRVVIALVCVTVVASGTAVAGWTGAMRRTESRQVLRFPIEFTDPIRLRNRSDPAVSISSDGTRLLYFAAGGHRVMDLTTGISQPVSTEKTGISASFSPSGDSVVIRAAGWLGQLWVVDLATHRASLLADSAVNWMRWDTDGWVYYRDLASGLRRIRVSDRKQEVLISRSASDSSYPENAQPMPNGAAFIYSRRARISDDLSETDISVFDRNSRTSRTLTRGVDAKVSPSGHLVFAQADGSLLAARLDGRSLRLDGSPKKVLDSVLIVTGFYSRAAFDIAHDGTLVYVREAPSTPDTIFTVGRDGKPGQFDGSWRGWIVQGAIALSTDGARWAASQNIGHHTVAIWVRDDRHSEPRRLTFGWTLDYYPRFVNGARDVAFVSPRGGRNWDLYSVPYDGNAEPTLLLDRPGDIVQPRFSATGRWVVFCERENLGGEDIVAHRFGTDSATVSLVATRANECYPDISQDERWLAYESTESGRREVFVRRFNAPGAPMQVSTAGGRLPRWSANGRELLFVNDRGQVVAVAVSTDMQFTFGTPRVLFTPDDRTIWSGELTGSDELIMVRQKLEAPGQVIVVRNFTELLREKVGR